MRLFKTKFFQKYARKQNITDDELCDAVTEIENGLVEADYGANLFKKRLARKGQGKSGGYRLILAFVKGDKTFFLYGFEKSAKSNVTAAEVRDFKRLALTYLTLSDQQLLKAIDEEVLFEVRCDEKDI